MAFSWQSIGLLENRAVDAQSSLFLGECYSEDRTAYRLPSGTCSTCTYAAYQPNRDEVNLSQQESTKSWHRCQKNYYTGQEIEANDQSGRAAKVRWKKNQFLWSWCLRTCSHCPHWWAWNSLDYRARPNKTVDWFHGRTENYAVINICQENHVGFQVQAWINFQRAESSVHQALLQLLKPVETSLLQTIQALFQF